MFLGELYSEQIPAAEFLANRRKVLLGWEQGCGKSVISLAAIDKLLELNKAKRVLILCPSALTWQWEEMAEKFTDLEVKNVTAKDKNGRKYHTVEQNITYITSYNLYRRDYNEIYKVPWDIVVTDEAEEFSSTKAKTRKLLLEFNREVDPKYRWALTGTSIATKLEELYSIMYWVDKTFFPPWPEFEKRHIIRDRFGRITKYKNLKDLNIYIQNRVSRKTHKDMEGMLPKILHKTHYLEKTKEYRNAEKKLMEQLQKMADSIEFTKDGEIKKSRRNAKLARSFHSAKQSVVSQKYKYAVQLIDRTLHDNKSTHYVVFSFYKEPLYELQKELGELHHPTFLFTGDVEDKRGQIKQFKEEGGVLLCSNAGARGLDLPFANYILHLDVPFSFSVLDQRNKRTVRASSSFKSVVVNYLIIKDSIEHYFFNQVKKIGMLNDAVFEGKYDEVSVKSESLRQFLKNGTDKVVK